MFIIGDVHGCLKTLKALVERLPDKDNIIFVGDLIDRGPSSSEVLDYIRSHATWQVVRGNHEDMMLHYYNVPNVKTCTYTPKNWILNGGEPSLYREDQIDWVASWPLYLELFDEVNKDGKHLFVSHAAPYYNDDLFHKNFNFDVSMWFLDLTILWHRGLPWPHPDRYYVFGHTPEPEAIVTSDYAMVDTGCAYIKRSKDLKSLTAIEFPSGKLYTQENIEDSP